MGTAGSPVKNVAAGQETNQDLEAIYDSKKGDNEGDGDSALLEKLI